MKKLFIVLLLALPILAQAEEQFIVSDAARFYKLVPRDGKLELLGEFNSTEGPVWIGGDDGYLVFKASPMEMMKWSLAGGIKSYRKPTNCTNGSALDPQGRLVSCEEHARRIARVNPDGTSEALAETYGGKRFNSPNDIVIRSDGTIWFTDPRYGNWHGPAELDGNYVYRIDPKTVAVSIATKDFKFPNGICLSPDEKILYIGQGGFGDFIRAYDIAADGTLTNGRQLCKTKNGLPDGFKCDEQGNIFTSSEAGVEIFTPAGEYLGTILTQPRAANLCFGGPGRKTLFITAKTKLYKINLNVAGVCPPKSENRK